MGNYHYIIAGLPELVLNADNKGFSYDSVRESIYWSSDEKDRRLIEWFDFGTNEENLNPHFYRAAMNSRNAFIRQYFALDLEIRNRKVDFVAGKMERDGAKYKIQVNNNAVLNLNEEQLHRLQSIFENRNILEKEQLLDKFLLVGPCLLLVYNKIIQLFVDFQLGYKTIVNEFGIGI